METINTNAALNAAFTRKEDATRRVLALYSTGRRGTGTQARREAQRSLLVAQEGYLFALGAMRNGSTKH